METITDPVKFFSELGGVHDARVEWLCWDGSELRVVLSNLNSNFMGGDRPNPEYAGYAARPATVIFCGVRNLSGHIRSEPSHISALDVLKMDDQYRIDLVGTDTWMFSFECTVVGLEAAGQPASVDLHYAALKA